MGRHFKRSSVLCKYRMQGWDPTMLAYIKYGERERELAIKFVSARA